MVWGDFLGGGNLTRGQGLSIQGFRARFDSRFNSTINLKIRFNSILQKIEVDFIQFDSWLQLLESP